MTRVRIGNLVEQQSVFEFDEDKIDLIVNDVRDDAHLNVRRATQRK